ncbi:NUDIX hydrolase [Patescibacteria group bacterium]|nr:NUDIX hydrolase [Patescibacteria group bacterium]
MVNDRDEILLIKRGREPFAGHWALISGIGESKKGIKPEKGVIEEVNCDVQTSSFRGEHAFSVAVKSDKFVDEVVVFVGKVDESNIKVNPPFSVDLKWVSEEEAKKFKALAFEHKKIINEYMRRRKLSV